MTSYETEYALVYLAEQIIKTFGKDFGIQVSKQEPAEPLIKDEKIRKAVRAFSEAIQEKKHILVIKQCGLGIAEFSNGSRFWIRLPLSNETMDALEDRTYYTITELCGESES